MALSWHKVLKLSEFLGKATIDELHLNFKSEKIWVKPEGPKQLSQVFHRLRLVNLINISEECDLTWTMFILQGAPFLKELCITVWDYLCEMVRNEERSKKFAFSEEKKDKGAEWEASDFKHHNLAVLKISGFQPEDKFLGYIRCVMEAAVDLEDIYLYNKPVCKPCNHKVPKSSTYPWTGNHRRSIRNRINRGMCSLRDPTRKNQQCEFW